MNSEPFIIERILNAPIQKVWDAISNREKMKLWYFDLAEFKPEVGFEFQFEGQDADCKSYIHLCKVTEVVPGRKLQYSWRYEGYPGDSLVTFELFGEGENQTKIRLTHSGLETFPADVAAFAKANFAAGWTDIIGNQLKNFVEQV